MVTVTDEVQSALAVAARRWPGEAPSQHEENGRQQVRAASGGSASENPPQSYYHLICM